VTILDAYAVIAYLRGERAAEKVRPLLTVRVAQLSAVGRAEVVDHFIRFAGVNEEDALLDLAQLGLLNARPADAAIGTAAGRLRARLYHRSRCQISRADCVAAETARADGRPLATADPDLLDACHSEGIGIIALPGSDGTTWSPPAESV
jgi:PIN domain nuclease of toxin-antitoxin system